MTTEEFAKFLRAAMDAREASWDEATAKYKIDFHDALELVGVDLAWREPMFLILFSGYADIWDWCDDILGPVRVVA